ncbi:v-type proton atpase subunit g [Anaeramoeba flamelloides]|uniref:V-type proton atpase subunit g n=1 Tax=Anaeramoeba flamelloides TaxID=1746091 RepID=A0AAV7ZG31_9EUKA|nr:v-type proton atpase subunit g [Anaeramoeba flamelloides]KAJ6254809.1 v-type proton atpase subunit g [Anaeramoeba flamelloides]
MSNEIIQELQQAEETASSYIELATKFQVKRVHQAKDEAIEDIKRLRQMKQEEFELYRKERLGSSKENVKENEERTQKEIKETIKYAQTKKKEAIQLLLDTVLNIDLEIVTPKKEEGEEKEN